MTPFAERRRGCGSPSTPSYSEGARASRPHPLAYPPRLQGDARGGRCGRDARALPRAGSAREELIAPSGNADSACPEKIRGLVVRFRNGLVIVIAGFLVAFCGRPPDKTPLGLDACTPAPRGEMTR
jgi:hypothetical protein